ncbi:MAG: type I restriction enzyme HsdR N-terminal domain-containing protein [Bacteroidetes bacterium]|nr:type I restriction enzyme HsdR N-terminal domain-containing protein [Bacteroidota bacterium]
MELKKLNLPEYSFRIRQLESRTQIFDVFRKRFVALTPEEWVRQNFLMFLVTEKNYPRSLISVEGGMKLFKRMKRTDIVVYNNLGNPLMIIECKAPDVKIDEKVFDQVVRYNMVLKVKFLVLTNGLNHYSCLIDYQNKSYHFLPEIPDFKQLK